MNDLAAIVVRDVTAENGTAFYDASLILRSIGLWCTDNDPKMYKLLNNCKIRNSLYSTIEN